MTDSDEVASDIERLRATGTDLARIEVKAARGGVPKSLWDTISAFANTAGGRIILGLDERTGFATAEGFDASRTRDQIVSGLSNQVAPRPSSVVDLVRLDGFTLVVVDIEELPPHEKPCYVVAKGKERGSYRRDGDGDHRMSTYEVFLHTANVRQPDDDVAPVDGASVVHLDNDITERFLDRLRKAKRRAVEGANDREALRRLNVLAKSADEPIPTVAGLLALGRYPQEFFPQWMITVAVYPGATKDTIVGDLRMLDQATIDGPIPVMVERTVEIIIRNLRSVVRSRGVSAVTSPEIPVDVLREAVTNALTHRDYSAFVRGEQVRVEVFPDRVEVISPGGIWGGRSESDLLDGVSRSRNEKLALLLQDIPLPGTDGVVCENRGSGIPRMVGLMRQQGLALPMFRDLTTSFVVRLDRHGLLDPETQEWLTSIGAGQLDTQRQCVLALVGRGTRLDDQTIRYQLAIDSRDAQHLLASLANDGWLVNPSRPRGSYTAGERLTRPTLFESSASTQPTRSLADRSILEALEDNKELNVHDLAARAELSVAYARARLRVLIDQGHIEATAPPTSRQRRYRLRRL